MNISSVKGYSFSNNALKNSNSINFKGDKKEANNEYYNPVDVKTERNLAILTSTGISVVMGAIGTGLISAVANKKVLSRIPLLAGAAIAAITIGLTLPLKLYDTKVKATVREKQMDIFTRDAELKKDLTKEVHDEVKDPDVSLDKKLAHNTQLQLANKAAMVGFKTF